MPTNTRGTGNSIAYSKLDRRRTAEDGPTVLKVRVALPPVLVSCAGLVLPNEQDGAGVTTGAMLHDRVTLPVYPFAAARVIVAVDDPPGLIVPGEGVPADIE